MRIAQEEIFGPVLSVDGRSRRSTRPWPLPTASSTACRRRIYTRDVNLAFRAMRDLETGIVYVNAPTIGRGDAPAVRRQEEHRQRPPGGGPRRPRHVHRVEVDLRGFQRPAAAGADRHGIGRHHGTPDQAVARRTRRGPRARGPEGNAAAGREVVEVPHGRLPGRHRRGDQQGPLHGGLQRDGHRQGHRLLQPLRAPPAAVLRQVPRGLHPASTG